MRLLSRAVLVGLLVLAVTVTGRAAGVVLQGTIVDPAGMAIPGATVELIAGGKTVAKTVTAADGGFRFADVAAGTYDVNVSLAGFRQTRTTVAVGTTAVRPLRLTLLIGSVSETVNVTSDAAPRSDVPGGAWAVLSAPPPAQPKELIPITGAGGLVAARTGGRTRDGVIRARSQTQTRTSSRRAMLVRRTERSTKTNSGARPISRSPPSRSTSTRRRTPTSGGSSTKAACRRPTPSASRS